MKTEQTKITEVAKENSENVTLIIDQYVRRSEIARYEQWLHVIMAQAAKSPGHQGVHVIRPSDGGNEYSVIIRFATLDDAIRWTKSAERKKLVAEIADAFEKDDQLKIHPGIEFWFTPPSTYQKKAAGWKQWIITTSVIWPLTTLMPILYKPLLAAIPVLRIWGVYQGIYSMTTVALVTFLIMPRYVRAVSGWLFK